MLRIVAPARSRIWFFEEHGASPGDGKLPAATQLRDGEIHRCVALMPAQFPPTLSTANVTITQAMKTARTSSIMSEAAWRAAAETFVSHRSPFQNSGDCDLGASPCRDPVTAGQFMEKRLCPPPGAFERPDSSPFKRQS